MGRAAQRCGWGAPGTDPRLGRLVLATPERFLEAAGALRSGAAVPLAWSVALPRPAILGRRDVRHTVTRVPDGWDDHLDSFYPQGSSQWDALCHCRHPELGYWGGAPSPDDLEGGVTVRTELGIHRLAEHGVAARFVLVDLTRTEVAASDRRYPAVSLPLGADRLRTILKTTGTQLRGGEILLLRTGWLEHYEGLDDRTRWAMAEGEPIHAPGLAPEESLLEWLWDSDICGVASDTPSLEVMPFDTSRADGFLHYQLIPLLGFLVGELFDLRRLAAACAAASTWSGCLVSAPLLVPGGVGSPANAVAFV